MMEQGHARGLAPVELLGCLLRLGDGHPDALLRRTVPVTDGLQLAIRGSFGAFGFLDRSEHLSGVDADLVLERGQLGERLGVLLTAASLTVLGPVLLVRCFAPPAAGVEPAGRLPHERLERDGQVVGVGRHQPARLGG